MFFSLAFLLSTVFSDVWRPPLIALCVAAVLALVEQVVRDLVALQPVPGDERRGLFPWRWLPWLGLLASAAVSAAMLYAAVSNIARRDF